MVINVLCHGTKKNTHIAQGAALVAEHAAGDA